RVPRSASLTVSSTAAERALPESIIEHGYRNCRRRIVTHFQDTARHRLHSQRLEKIPRNELAVDHARRAVAGHGERTRVGKRCHSGKWVRFWVLVCPNYSKGLKWSGLGFGPGSFSDSLSPIKNLRLHLYFERNFSYWGIQSY